MSREKYEGVWTWRVVGCIATQANSRVRRAMLDPWGRKIADLVRGLRIMRALARSSPAPKGKTRTWGEAVVRVAAAINDEAKPPPAPGTPEDLRRRWQTRAARIAGNMKLRERSGHGIGSGQAERDS